MLTDNNTEAFLELVRAGLFPVLGQAKRQSRAHGEEFKVNGSSWNNASSVDWSMVDYEELMRLAEEQSVVGLVTAGLELVQGEWFKVHGVPLVPQEVLLQFIGSTLQIEQQNQAMNVFLAALTEKLRRKDVHAVLVKGQGIAQCYEKPLWRTSGDIDLLLSEDNYNASKAILEPIADEVGGENKVKKHQALVIKGFDVELHGRMPFGMSRLADEVIDEVIRSSFKEGNVRSWQNNGIEVPLPSVNNDVIIVFTHFLHHFFIEGVGLRQICDWCRMLWTYKDALNYGLLEARIRKAGLMSEWKAFGALAVNTLGMPQEAMPFYDSRFKVKGERVLDRIMKCGNFGHNNDLSYRKNLSGMTYNFVSFWRRIKDFIYLASIFPIDAPKFFVTYVCEKVK